MHKLTNKILIKDILEHSSAFANKRSKFISMTSDPNVVLTYDRENLHRFVLVKVDREEIIKNNTMFSAGNYLLDGMEQRVEELLPNAPEEVKGIIDRVDQATTIEEIREIINGADRKLKTSLIDKEQQYLEAQEQLRQAKGIAKCEVLNYYGIMQNG